jgi:hypothetical protein
LRKAQEIHILRFLFLPPLFPGSARDSRAGFGDLAETTFSLPQQPLRKMRVLFTSQNALLTPA